MDIGFHWSAFRNHEGSTFTEKDRNKVNDRIGPLRSDSVIKLVSDLITELDQDVRAVHSCNSWFLHYFWSRLINAISKDPSMVFAINVPELQILGL